jgi:sugar-specific transcriptional regulator TrmB
MRMRIENGIKDNESLIISELMPMYEKSGTRERPEIWVVRGIYNIAAKVGEIVQTCQQELLIALPQVAEDIAKPIQPLLRILHEKGVKITVLASEESNPDTIRALSRISTVRLKNSMFGGGVIGDGKQVIILLGEAKRDSGGGLEPIAIWADHTGLARFAKDYFHYLWADASETGNSGADHGHSHNNNNSKAGPQK